MSVAMTDNRVGLAGKRAKEEIREPQSWSKA